MNSLWDRLDPGFFEPVWLAVGALAVLAIVLLDLGARRRRREALAQLVAPHLVAELTASVSLAKRTLKEILLMLGVAFLFVALARPHLFYQIREEQRTGFDVLLAVDCSKSMLTEDVKPSRLERAKLAVADFAEHLPGNRLGLIAFAGDAFLQCPLTIDHEAFLDAVQDLDTDTIPRPGTDVASAISEALQAEQSQPNNLKLLILITDGEDLEGHALDAARQAAAAGLKIYTVGVGTPAGALIPQRDENGDLQYLHDASGQIVQSRLDEGMLRQIASITGGEYEPLGQGGEGLDTVYQRYIAPLPKQHLEDRQEKVRFEQYEWPLGLSMLSLAWSLMINERAARAVRVKLSLPVPVRRRRPAPIGAALSLVVLGIVLTPRAFAAATDTAEKAYESGKYDQAQQGYQQAADAHPNRQDFRFNQGDAAYRAGDFTGAENAFRQSLDTPDLGLQERAYYNLGNTQFRHGEAMEQADQKRTMELWKNALQSYDSSLKLRQTADAQHNYDVVKKRLQQLQQQQQQQQQNQQQKDSQQNKDQQQQSGQGSPKQQSGGGQQPQQQLQSNPGQQKNQQGQSQQQNGQPQPDQNGQPQQPQDAQSGQQQGNQDQPKTVQARSAQRSQDQQDPGAKSREEAEALLDSLKDEEKRMTAKSLNDGNDVAPPPSGKDW